LSGRPGNVSDYDSCQGNVRNFTKSRGSFREKSCRGKVAKNCLLLVMYLSLYGYFVASTLLLYVNYAVIIMKSLCHIIIIDNSTSTA